MVSKVGLVSSQTMKTTAVPVIRGLVLACGLVRNVGRPPR